MIDYLLKRIVAGGWLPPDHHQNPQECLGVLLRRSRGLYVTAPDPLNHILLGAAMRLNLAVAMTMRVQILDGILASLAPGQSELRFKDGSQLQIIDSLTLAQPANIRKFQYACVCRQERLILVWQDDIQNIIPQATRVEERLLSLIWGHERLPFSILQMPVRTPSILSSGISSVAPGTPGLEKGGGAAVITNVVEDNDDMLERDVSLQRPESLSRPVYRTSAFFIGMSMCLAICLLGGVYIGKLVRDSMLDGDYTRMALVAPLPLICLVSLFFFQVIFTNLFQIIGPIGGATTNSRYYSCYKPSLRRAYQDGFIPPKVTIQLPVYKEGMDSVIIPTVKSLQAAISYYESHGGSANIFVNDDGMRAGISEEEVQRRRDFYHDNHIGWVARPGHSREPGGFIRAGKFKKASNMNFALNVSQRVEARLQELIDTRLAQGGSDELDENEEDEVYQSCLAQVLAEDATVWAEGDIRVGEIILIVDSDTRIPVDCLLYGAAEMFLSPEVAIVQHSTGVMQVAHDYFENGITFFTNLVYTSIRFSICSGEVVPFVGHNAFLRWQGMSHLSVAHLKKRQESR